MWILGHGHTAFGWRIKLQERVYFRRRCHFRLHLLHSLLDIHPLLKENFKSCFQKPGSAHGQNRPASNPLRFKARTVCSQSMMQKGGTSREALDPPRIIANRPTRQNDGQRNCRYNCPILHFHVAADQSPVNDDDVIPQGRVMSHVRQGHDKVMVTHPGGAAGTVPRWIVAYSRMIL